MKKFYTLAAATLLTVGAFSQVCTPNGAAFLTVLDPLPTNPLNDAPVGVPFTKTISFIASGNDIDLSVVSILIPNLPVQIPPGSSVSVDRIKVEGVDGLPPGLTSQCNNTGCEWTPGNSGCIKISGTPTQAGEYEITFNTIFEISYLIDVPFLGPTPGNFTTPAPVPVTYDMRVLNNASIQDFSTAGLNIFPNPANDVFTISYPNVDAKDAVITVTDMSGKTVFSATKSVDSHGGNIQIDIDGFSNGMYRVSFTAGNVNTATKLVVNK